ncbi:AraC family transcriptional regulator [Paenibacillus glucanolyticus]|uniref:AraC family transcriptional regulator n=1 Tax=Paenibacillus glucanolyticus TaxID=59843 RepID=UPI0012DBC021|nr:AraC family transcriptional regulator [Paenibacillus glucanolyticus]MPY17171.1 AraC family transcriptional regulator [Paenibacillus glucanolyticus]
MAAEVTRVYKEHVPSARLIGKRYGDEDRDAAGSFAGRWAEWFVNGWFEEIGKLGALPESEGSSYGLMRMNGDRFEYWIGMLFPTNTAAPDGYQYEDLAEGDVGVCWLYGNADNGELYGMDPHNVCMAKIAEQGWQQRANAWFFERYHHPRFTTPDEKGNVVLDYGVYVK